MICMEDQCYVHGPFRRGRRPFAGQHVDEIGCVLERRIGWYRVVSMSNPFDGGNNTSDLSGEAVSLAEICFCGARITVRIIKRQGRGCGAQHIHRLCIFRKRPHHRKHLWRNRAGLGQIFGQPGEFSRPWKPPKPEQIANFFEVGLSANSWISMPRYERTPLSPSMKHMDEVAATT